MTNKKTKENTSESSITVIPLGGYSEVGRNCVAVKIKEEVFVLDMGLAIDKYIEFTESEEYDNAKVDGQTLIDIGAAPDLSLLGEDKNKVKAILLTHAHLDHIQAVPYLANDLKAPLYATPFTAEIIKANTFGERMPLKERLWTKKTGKRFKLTKNVEAEFIHVTHSVPDTAAIALHSPEGTALYITDYKFDEHPTKGKKSDTEALERLKGVDVVITDALYAHKEDKVPSENYVRSLLFNLLQPEKVEGKIIVATTFASHIYRLMSLVEIAKKIGRKPMFLGRSLAKYIEAAEKKKIAQFSNSCEIVKFGGKVESALKKIKNPQDYFFISTGNQGEPKAALYKIVDQGWLPFKQDDLILFSSITIPVEPNITYRENLEKMITNQKMEILKDVHVSGHGSQVDMKRLLEMTKPKHIIPMHAEVWKLEKFKEMSVEMGFEQAKVHVAQNGDRINVA